MNEYLTKTGMKLLNEISSEIASLASEVEKYDIQQYVCTMGGISKGCLDEMCRSEVSEASEFIALCDAIVNLAGKPGMEKITDIAKTAERLRTRWMDKRYHQAVNAQDIVDELVRASDKDTETEFLSCYHFFLDASSLCSDQMPIFLDKLLPTLLDYKNPIHITVPQAVVDCLDELSADARQAELTQANSGIMQLKRIQDVGLLSIRGDEGDTTLMSTFLSAFSRFKPKYQMVLITQDAALANAVYLLNSSGVEGNDILISSLQEDGVLALWFANEGDSGKILQKKVNSNQGQKDALDVNHSVEDEGLNKNKGEIADLDYVGNLNVKGGIDAAVNEVSNIEKDKDLSTNHQNYHSNEANDEDNDEEDDGEEHSEETILSEDELEKIMNINRLLTEDEDGKDTEGGYSFSDSDDDAHFLDTEKEVDLQGEENLDDLESLEEESLELYPQIESEYDDTDEESIPEPEIAGNYRQESQQSAEDEPEEDIQLMEFA